MCGSLIIHQVHYTVYEKLKSVDVWITDNTQVHYTVYEKLKSVDVWITDNTSGTLYCL